MRVFRKECITGIQQTACIIVGNSERPTTTGLSLQDKTASWGSLQISLKTTTTKKKKSYRRLITAYLISKCSFFTLILIIFYQTNRDGRKKAK